MKKSKILGCAGAAVLTLLMSGSFIISDTMTVLAGENIESYVIEQNDISDEENPYSNIGVAVMQGEEEEGITPRGLSAPSEYINLQTEGPLTFAGQASGSTLYTNRGFTNATSVTIYVKNYHSQTLTVKLHRRTGFLDPVVHTMTIVGDTQMSSYLPNLSADQKYYLTFDAPSDFAGNVRAR